MIIKKEEGMTLIVLIISIIVIIILSLIIIGTAVDAPGMARKASFLKDLSMVQQAVTTTRMLNIDTDLKSDNDENLNIGFLKVKIKKTEDSPEEDGWIVDLNTIDMRKIKFGQDYDDTDKAFEGMTINFGDTAPDVYVYDKNEIVYYAKGYKSTDEIIYSQAYRLPISKEGIIIVEPDNIADWTFNTSTGVITRYVGATTGTLTIPNYINGVRVNSIASTLPTQGITYGKNIQYVIISKGITSIGNSAFYNCSNITSITLPNSVTSLGTNSFGICTGLSSITLPNGLVSIGNSSFFNCTNMTSITIPGTVTTIGTSAFSYCTKLTSITVPNSVTSLGSSAFFGCSLMKTATLPSNLTGIPDSLFSLCSVLNNLTIPTSVTSIGNSSFYYCSGLKSIVIPNNVTSINTNSFLYCNSLTQITVNKSIDSIAGAPWGATNATVTWTQ
jgi:type II secretory pathway pseudopilin PulG